MTARRAGEEEREKWTVKDQQKAPARTGSAEVKEKAPGVATPEAENVYGVGHDDSRVRAPVQATCPRPVEIFAVRAEAWALLVKADVADVDDAVDHLLHVARSTGLIDELGPRAVLKILAEAFAKVWRRRP